MQTTLLKRQTTAEWTAERHGPPGGRVALPRERLSVCYAPGRVPGQPLHPRPAAMCL